MAGGYVVILMLYAYLTMRTGRDGWRKARSAFSQAVTRTHYSYEQTAWSECPCDSRRKMAGWPCYTPKPTTTGPRLVCSTLNNSIRLYTHNFVNFFGKFHQCVCDLAAQGSRRARGGWSSCPSSSTSSVRPKKVFVIHSLSTPFGKMEQNKYVYMVGLPNIVDKYAVIFNILSAPFGKMKQNKYVYMVGLPNIVDKYTVIIYYPRRLVKWSKTSMYIW